MEHKLEFGDSHWLDIEGPSPEEFHALATRYGLPISLVEDCLEPDLLPKFQRTANSSFLILRAHDEKADPKATSVQEATRKVALFWSEDHLITIHRVHLPWLADLREKWKARSSRGPVNLGQVLYEIIEECIFTYDAPIDHATLTVEELEEAIFRDSSGTAPSHILESAFHAKKRAMLFKRMLRLTRDLLPSVSKLGEPSSPALQSLKEESDRLFFYSDDLVETTNDLVQLSISLSANRTNEVIRLLTVVSIFLLPLNLVTGIYGMNFAHMPELALHWGYPAAIGLMLLIELSIYLWLRKKRWLD